MARNRKKKQPKRVKCNSLVAAWVDEYNGENYTLEKSDLEILSNMHKVLSDKPDIYEWINDCKYRILEYNNQFYQIIPENINKNRFNTLVDKIKKQHVELLKNETMEIPYPIFNSEFIPELYLDVGDEIDDEPIPVMLIINPILTFPDNVKIIATIRDVTFMRDVKETF